MKVIIFCFSGTGNTERITQEWVSEILANGHEADLIKLDKDTQPIDLSAYDRVGFAYPVHAFNAPEPVWRYAKTLAEQPKSKPAFFLMVSGEPLNMNHRSGDKLARILKRKNIHVESAYHYVMPYNMIFRHSEAKALRMWSVAQKITHMDARDYIVNGINNKLPRPVLMGWFIGILRIEQWFTGWNGRMFKIDAKKCVRCMKCINACPMGNIKYEDGKFKFGKDCVCCTRCSFNCPVDAFSIGLLNAWRVNKPYVFAPVEEGKEKHSRYCRRAYKKYFANAEARIAAAETHSEKPIN